MFFLLQLNAIIIFWLEPLILLYILLVYCVPTFVRNHVENTAKQRAPRPVLNLARTLKKHGAAGSRWSPFHTKEPPWWTGKHAGAKKTSSLTQFSSLCRLFFSVFFQDKRHLFCEDSSLFSRQKGSFDCCFCFKNSLALLLQQHQLTKKVLFSFLFSLNSFI